MPAPTATIFNFIICDGSAVYQATPSLFDTDEAAYQVTEAGLPANWVQCNGFYFYDIAGNTVASGAWHPASYNVNRPISVYPPTFREDRAIVMNWPSSGFTGFVLQSESYWTSNYGGLLFDAGYAFFNIVIDRINFPYDDVLLDVGGHFSDFMVWIATYWPHATVNVRNYSDGRWLKALSDIILQTIPAQPRFDEKRRADACGLYLTGGASNTNPDSSLGGVPSSKLIKGVMPFVTEPIPAIQIKRATPAIGEGAGALLVDENGDLVFTPPGGSARTPVTIAEDETIIIYDETDEDKGIVVKRVSGLSMKGSPVLDFDYPYNGAIAHGNISNAQRVAGVTTYRALAIKAHGPFALFDIKLWLPTVAGAQATYAIGLEAPSGGSIQTIADEETAPSAVLFSSPTSEGAALTISQLDPGDVYGLWIRRAFPAAGVVAAREDVKLTIKFTGA